MSDAPGTLHAVAHEVALSLVEQPDLFPAESDPRVPATVAGLLSRRPHTGARVTDDRSKVLLVCALRSMGWSDRRIAAAAGVARESIGPILEHGERTGVVRPLKERLASAIGMLAEESAAAARELVQEVRDGVRDEGVTMSLRALGPMLGIATEKVQLLTGSPTEILETREGRAPADEAAFLARLRADIEAQTVNVTPATDSESAGQPRNPLSLNGVSGADTVPDTGAPVQEAEMVTADQVPPGGRGSAAAATGQQVDGSRGCEISGNGAQPEGANP